MTFSKCHHDFLSVASRLYQICASRKNANRAMWTARALPSWLSVAKKIVAPKIRSKAVTSRRYSLPLYCIPNVSSISAPLLKRIVWLFCWTVSVARKMGTIRCQRGTPNPDDWLPANQNDHCVVRRLVTFTTDSLNPRGKDRLRSDKTEDIDANVENLRRSWSR